MKDTKRVFGAYAAWEYAREIDDLNKMSEKGWHLAKGGLYSNLFKKDESVQYRYQIDYNPKIEDKARYIETFREQGWEYINSTFNGWHYFKKVYDASLPAEQYEIYCDNQSLLEDMQGRWKKLAKCLGAVLGVTFVMELIATIRAFSVSSAILTGVLLLELILVIFGSFQMNKPKRADGIKKTGRTFTAMVIVLFAGLLAAVITLFI